MSDAGQCLEEESMRIFQGGTGHRNRVVSVGTACLALVGFAALAQAPQRANVSLQQASGGVSLVAFQSDAELRRFLQERQQRARRLEQSVSGVVASPASPPPAMAMESSADA